MIWWLEITLPSGRHRMKMGGMGRERWSSQPAWDGNHFKDAGPHRRSVPRCVRGVWKAEMAAVWAHAKDTSGKYVEKIWFFTQQSQGGEGKTGRIRKKMRNSGAAFKKKARLVVAQSGANYFPPFVSPKGFVGSEVEPRYSSEDCIWPNCAVVFYTIVNGWDSGWSERHMVWTVSGKEVWLREVWV